MEFGILAKAVSSSSNDAIRNLTLSLLLSAVLIYVLLSFQVKDIYMMAKVANGNFSLSWDFQ